MQRAESMGAMMANLVASLGKTQSGAMLSAFVDVAVRADQTAQATADRLAESGARLPARSHVRLARPHS